MSKSVYYSFYPQGGWAGENFEIILNSVSLQILGQPNCHLLPLVALCVVSSERNCQGWAYVLFKITQRSCVLLHSFQNNEQFSRSFAIFIKRTKHSLRSFTFIIKERGVLCVLLCSLQKNATFFAFFYVLCKRMWRSLRSFMFFIKEC